MRKTMFLMAAVLLLVPLALAANDPGHDSLYVEEQGDSRLNGTFNISENQTIEGGELEISNQFKIRGDGNNPTSNLNYIVSDHQSGISINTNGVNGTLRLQDGTPNGLVQIGDSGGSSFVDLNVSNDFYLLGNLLKMDTNFELRTDGSSPGSSINSIVVNGTGSQMWLNSDKIILSPDGNSLGSVLIGEAGSNEDVLLNVTGDLVVQGGSGTINGSSICTPLNGLCGSGGSNVSGSGANTQVAYWTGSSNLAGSSSFTWDNSNSHLEVAGTINVTSGNDVCIEGGNCLSTASGSDSGGGWTNTSTVTTTNLDVNVTDGNMTLAGSDNRLIVGSTNTSLGRLAVTGTTGNIGDSFLLVDSNQGSFTVEAGGTIDLTGSIRYDGSMENDGDHVFSTTSSNNYIVVGANMVGVKRSGSNSLRLGNDDGSPLLVSGSFIDANPLYVNSTNGNVGIGLANPTEKLHVNGSLNVTSGNDVCIEGGNCLSNSGGSDGTGGWTNTTTKTSTALDVNVSDVFYVNSTSGIVTINATSLRDSSIDGGMDVVGDIAVGRASEAVIRLYTGTTERGGLRADNAGNLYIESGGTGGNPVETIYFADDNNVGIGIADPTYKLHVDGNITATSGNDICIAGGNCLSNAGSGSGNITGSGTSNTLTKWTGSGTIGNSQITDDGSSISFNTNDFFVNTTSGNIGMGTNTPNYGFDLNKTLGITGNTIYFDTDTGGSQALQIGAPTTAGGTSMNRYLEIQTNSDGAFLHGFGNSESDIGLSGGLSATSTHLRIKGNTGYVGITDSTPDAHLEVSTDGGTSGYALLISSNDDNDGDLFTINESGNVGIGTTTPEAKLEVDGGIRMNTSSIKPSCSSSQRGTMWYEQRGASTDDILYTCMKNSTDNYNWVMVARGG